MQPRPTVHSGNIIERVLEREKSLFSRTFLGFTQSNAEGLRVEACFALCATNANADLNPIHFAHDACTNAVQLARIDLSTPPFARPPAPSLWLRALLAVLHHARTSVAALVGLALIGGWIAITTRRRPSFTRH